jgi:RsiW-degrading membrane proteinase PrsW (M82 family)
MTIVLVALATLAILLARGARLPGTHDVALDYETHASTGLAAPARRRLAAARLHADVSAQGEHGLRVVVAAGDARAAQGWLAWHGAVRVFRLPPDAPVVAGTEPLVEVYARVAFADGKDLVVEPRDARALERRAAELGDETVTVAVAGSVLWRGALGRALEVHRGRVRLVIPVGDDIRAYSRARSFATLLDSPVLPALAKTDERPLPLDWQLAASAALLPFLVGLAWVALVRRFDRARPEPWWLMLATFTLGGLAQAVAGFVELSAWRATPYLDPKVMMLDGSASGFVLELGVTALVVGFVEEGAKLLAAWSLAGRRREFDEPVDGIIYGMVASIGFATAENVSYFASYRMGDSLIAVRSVESFIGHAFYGVLWGYALGRRLVAGRRGRVVPWFLLAVLLHALWDTLCDFGLSTALLAMFIALTTTFVVLIRRALRWGAIDQVRGDAPASSQRVLFRVGRPAWFAAAVAGMYGCGALLVHLARSAQHEGVRFALPTSSASAALVVLFGALALAATVAVPLDVAVDATGVTFAGGLWRWAEVLGVTRAGARRIELQTRAGSVSIGPGRGATIDALEAAVRARVGAHPEPHA